MLKNLKLSFIITSILYIALGVVLLMWPTTSLNIICYAFGGITLIYGLARLASYLGNRENPSVLQGDLFFGVIMMGIGIFLLLKPDTILAILPIVIGLFIIFNSVIKLQYAFELKSEYYDKWWILLYLGIATAALGTIVAVNPFSAIETTVMVMGSILVIDGVANIFTILFVTIVLYQLKRVAADLAVAGAGAESVVDNTDPEVAKAQPVVDAEKSETPEQTSSLDADKGNQPPVQQPVIETHTSVSELMNSDISASTPVPELVFEDSSKTTGNATNAETSDNQINN